MTSNYLIYIYL